MATGYILWDSKGRRMVAGPFGSSAEATAAIRRIKSDGQETAKSSKGITAAFTVETVTIT